MKELNDLIKQHEGYRDFVYDDATGQPVVQGYTLVGHPTIGFGRLLTGDRGISKAEAEILFDTDVHETVVGLSREYDWFDGLGKVRHIVVASMAFNLGLTTFRRFVNLKHAIQRSDWDNAADEILDSRAARQLPKRYKELSEMMRTGRMES